MVLRDLARHSYYCSVEAFVSVAERVVVITNVARETAKYRLSQTLIP